MYIYYVINQQQKHETVKELSRKSYFACATGFALASKANLNIRICLCTVGTTAFALLS